MNTYWLSFLKNLIKIERLKNFTFRILSITTEKKYKERKELLIEFVFMQNENE